MTDQPISVILGKEGRTVNYTGGQGRQRTAKIDREFDIYLGNEHVGTVEFRMADRQKVGNNGRLINRQWQTPVWFANPDRAHRGFGTRGYWETTSRKQAVADVIEFHLAYKEGAGA